MNPRIIAIAGPLEATIFPLCSDEVSIGRDPANNIVIADGSVSRRHCLIRKRDDHYRILDLDSHNGTFINEIPARERFLEHGDRIKVGSSLLLFLQHEIESSPSPNAVQLEDYVLKTDTAIRFHTEDNLNLMARDLNVLMRISLAINSVWGLNSLERDLFELILEVIPAQSGAILLVKENTNQFSSVFGLNRSPEPAQPVRLSRTIIGQVLREGVGILSNDVLENEQYVGTESLISAGVQSVICVPLALLGRVIGAIYLETCDPNVRFEKSHLQLITAIANISAGVLDKARHIEWLEEENRRLQSEIEHNMIGESQRMREVYQFITKVARTDSTVLINGESGTGKELIARAIHQNSPRASKPFVAVNCATLTETLLESELFGHEKGSFTGAVAQKKGKIEVADGGTLFLDEVGEIALPLQAKLLRAIQEREFERVGGTRPLKVDIRVIAATNRDLVEAVKEGVFRQDLYFRLNVVSLCAPPLRNRREDIPLLASYFISEYSRKCKRPVVGLSKEARTLLINYDWPGNVRELENAIERAIVLGSSSLILPEDLPETVIEARSSVGRSVTRYNEAVNEAKRQIILDALKEANGNYKEASNMLGIHPNNLHRLIRSMRLDLSQRKLLKEHLVKSGLK